MVVKRRQILTRSNKYVHFHTHFERNLLCFLNGKIIKSNAFGFRNKQQNNIYLLKQIFTFQITAFDYIKIVVQILGNQNNYSNTYGKTVLLLFYF